ncbi:ribonuclease R [Ideonella sp. TBM-1]|uniref:Ribonuclease R n=1 Tax=Ideonella livida TaxID=2707176 RepID=A0A7C9PFL7_9BURK|nr:ribonuclease R [Ideonella livida]NDY90693.1 ribonuclease R [Ideonella livida]
MKKAVTAAKSVQSIECVGTVQGHREGHGVVQPAEGGPGLFIPATEMRGVMHQDRVRAQVTGHDRKGRPEGRVVEILERRKGPIMGRLLQEGGAWLLAPEDRRYGQDILIPKTGTAGASPGQVVAVELIEAPALQARPVGRVVEILGEVDDPGLEIEIAVRKYDVPHVFSAAAVAQAEALSPVVRAVDRRGRLDLRDVALVTIDGDDARDFDDAVYAEPLRDSDPTADPDAWRLVVAIADVSHYVRPGDALDEQALERATSVYFPRRVIPMLPEALSNGLCSLNPEVDRLSMVCDMVVNGDGEVEAYQFFAATIRSHARLTYTEVASALGQAPTPEGQRARAWLPQLQNLHEVFLLLQRARRRRGAADFETTETQIISDEQGRIQQIVPRVRNDAHRLIEEAMLAANVCAADFILQSGLPALFRVHEGPTPEKRRALADYLRVMGVPASLPEEPRPADYQALLQATRDRPDAAQIQTHLLRSMQQAIYSPDNAGHFGLAYEAYTHFTSPIRRYPDLLVHRVLKELLASATEKSGSRRRRYRPDLEQWREWGQHCSANERRADEASKDVEAWLKCRYMREHLGEEFTGTVSGVAPFGLFVTLDSLYVEGLVHITELGGEYFRHDEVRQELRGERTGLRYVLGGKVRVQVSRVDLDGRRIDFRVVREGETDRLLERGRSVASGRGGSRSATPEAEVGAEEALSVVLQADRAHKRAARSARQSRQSTAEGRGRGGGAATPRAPARGGKGERGAAKVSGGAPVRGKRR